MIRHDEQDDQAVWEHAEIERPEYYAAAAYVDKYYPKEVWLPQIDGADKPQDDHVLSRTTYGQLLDQIASLFARAKSITSPLSARGNCPIHTSKQVTATALGGIESAAISKTASIVVAKNDGPQQLDG